MPNYIISGRNDSTNEIHQLTITAANIQEAEKIAFSNGISRPRIESATEASTSSVQVATKKPENNEASELYSLLEYRYSPAAKVGGLTTFLGYVIIVISILITIYGIHEKDAFYIIVGVASIFSSIPFFLASTAISLLRDIAINSRISIELAEKASTR